jgi:hypothetical protein
MWDIGAEVTASATGAILRQKDICNYYAAAWPFRVLKFFERFMLSIDTAENKPTS